jgi:hypothetical protein
MCVFQERLLLKNSSRNFVSIAVRILLSSYLICMSKMLVLLFVNWMNKVLSKFSKGRFDLNHLFNCAKTSLKSVCIWELLGLVSSILVSSANIMGKFLHIVLTALSWWKWVPQHHLCSETFIHSFIFCKSLQDMEIVIL